MTNETKLVTLPKEVAEAIESLKRKGYPSHEIMATGSTISLTDRIADEVTIHEWATGGYGFVRLEQLMSALVNGYQVKKTPEEDIQVYYSEIQTKWETAATGWQDGYYEGSHDAIQTTLGILGIKIEGVNA